MGCWSESSSSLTGETWALFIPHNSSRSAGPGKLGFPSLLTYNTIVVMGQLLLCLNSSVPESQAASGSTRSKMKLSPCHGESHCSSNGATQITSGGGTNPSSLGLAKAAQEWG